MLHREPSERTVSGDAHSGVATLASAAPPLSWSSRSHRAASHRPTDAQVRTRRVLLTGRSGAAQTAGSAGRLGDLLLEHHDALALLGRQHGDLLVRQLQHLHDQRRLAGTETSTSSVTRRRGQRAAFCELAFVKLTRYVQYVEQLTLCKRITNVHQLDGKSCLLHRAQMIGTYNKTVATYKKLA